MEDEQNWSTHAEFFSIYEGRSAPSCLWYDRDGVVQNSRILLQTSPDVFDIFAQTGTEIMNIDPFQTMPADQTVWASSDS